MAQRGHGWWPRLVPRLVFDLSHSRFPLCCSWPSQHKENVITGAGSVVTKETKQTSSALPEQTQTLCSSGLGRREQSEQHPHPVWQERG